MNPIAPTKGRIVYYVLPESEMNGGHVRPAIIVDVVDDVTVDLQQFTKGMSDLQSQGTCYRSMTAYKEPVAGMPYAPGTWHWMPYQLATAPKR